MFLPVIYALGGVFVVWVFMTIFYRTVVPTNMVHIVKSKKDTTSYGADQEGGNVYYSWPSWIPGIGVTVIKLAVSNFDLSLKDYEVYDKDGVSFMVDVTSFFRIKDASKAAQRVKIAGDLQEQLRLIVQGAVKKILASYAIDVIILKYSTFDNEFTSAVKEELADWGLESAKSMEIINIRDVHGSKVISNLMDWYCFRVI